MLLFIHQICFSNCVYDKENLTPLSLVYCAMVIKRHIKVLDDMLLLKVQKKKKKICCMPSTQFLPNPMNG